MPGFFISPLRVKTGLTNRYPDRCVYTDLSDENTTIKWNTLNKFNLDKVITNNEQYALVTDGVILNLRELENLYAANSLNDLIEKLYSVGGDTFFSQFVGPFSGALLDKYANKWIVWTNQIGDKAIFYSIKDNCFMAGSQINYLIDAMRELGIVLTFDEQAAYQMLTFGFMEGNRTYAKEIKRLRGGQYLTFQDGVLEVKEYFTLHKHPERFAGKSEAQIIEEVDRAFRRASEMEYAKDEEYGYKHLADLSGGLDARMNMWVAHSVKPRHIQFITYCKANYLDEQIAKQLAAHWHDELLVKPLDDLHYLFEIDEIVFMNAGLSLYSGITGGKRMLEQINFDLYGLEHTGQLNGGIIGSYLSAIGGGKMPTGMYSEKLKHRLSDTIHDQFDDHELYMLYTRGFQGVMNTQQIRSNYTEAFTTTVMPDFLQLCMDIPVEMRVNHSLYKKWILTKYPDAALYRWEKTGARITENRWIGAIRKAIRRGPNKIKRLIGKDHLISSGMNPLDYWIAHNREIQEYMASYAEQGYQYLPAEVSAELVNDMKNLFDIGTANEKTMVLTVLAAAKLYFGDERNGEGATKD